MSLFLFCTYLRIYPRWAFPPFIIWEISVEKIFSSSFITFDIFQMKSLYDFFCFLPHKTISYYWFLNEIFFLSHLYYTCTHTYILLIRDFFSTLLLEIMSLKFSLCFHFHSKLPSFDNISMCHHYVYCSSSCICERNEARRCF